MVLLDVLVLFVVLLICVRSKGICSICVCLAVVKFNGYSFAVEFCTCCAAVNDRLFCVF